jgi:acyl dehydratase
MSRTVSAAELQSMVGSELGVSEWFPIDQQRVDAFADVTEDHQFVHVDPERAKTTPYGGTIAHGLLTLSLIVRLCLPFVPEIAGRRLMLNYGFDKVRFPAPVKVGTRIRARVKLADAVERKPGQIMIKLNVVFDVEGGDKPALTAEWLSLHVIGDAP